MTSTSSQTILCNRFCKVKVCKQLATAQKKMICRISTNEFSQSTSNPLWHRVSWLIALWKKFHLSFHPVSYLSIQPTNDGNLLQLVNCHSSFKDKDSVCMRQDYKSYSSYTNNIWKNKPKWRSKSLLHKNSKKRIHGCPKSHSKRLKGSLSINYWKL